MRGTCLKHEYLEGACSRGICGKYEEILVFRVQVSGLGVM